jgi:serine/threonine-protein phosphatase 2A activator
MKSFSTLPGFEKAIPELSVYLQESFGEHSRIDYGTGHELNFVVFLFCMFKVGAFLAEDLRGAVNCVF